MSIAVENWLFSDDERSSSAVKIQLLGGVYASTAGGEPIDIGPAKCRTLFAALALSPGETIPVARLVDLVWDIAPPRTAEKTLQTYVMALRRGLGQGAIERVGLAYRLVVDPEDVDVSRFEQALAARDVGRALDEWTGPPLAGLDAPGLTPAVDRLVEQWFGAIESNLNTVVESDPAAAVAALTELSAEHPYREGLWSLLMTALYRTGRQADALAAYGRARTHLVEELGIEPGPALRELEGLILGHDDRLDRGRSTEHRSGLPTGTVTFAFSDIEASSRLWAENRLAMSGAVARHDAIVRAATDDHDGFVFSSGGDSFGVAFDRARDALRWAESVQKALGGEKWSDDAVVRVRIGVHSGEAEERGNDYFGPVVNLAARITAAGHGGQILLSHVTAALLEGRDFAELGSFRFDGIGSDATVFQADDEAHEPLRTGALATGNLPKRTGQLFGRDEELDAIADAVACSPIVTLVGPGGIGKTRLALAAARIAEIGVSGGGWLVELADIASSDDVVRAVADVLDVRPTAGRPLRDSVIAQLAAKPSVVVLDNCEHVIEGAAELAGAISERCQDVVVIATSREGLGLPEERLIVVGPLAVDGPAVQLFDERARAADPSFDAESERESVAEICSRLDGVPLAIELAAARIRSLSPGDMVERLDDRLRLLTGGRRRSVERHRTLRATIQWSFDLLSQQERQLLTRLSIFAAAFDLDDAVAVAADTKLDALDIDRLLGDLVGRSMVSTESGAFGRRFRLLETVRQFAAEHLSRSGSSHLVARRHAEHVRDEVARLGTMLMSNTEIEGAARLAELWPNVRAAADWALDSADVELARSMIEPIALQMFVRRGLDEIADWCERLLMATPADDEETRALGLLWLAMHHSMTQDADGFRGVLDRHGPLDHIFVRYAYIVAVEDNDFSALDVGPLVATRLRRRGQEAYARLVEMFTAASLMTSGEIVVARERHLALAEAFRSDGPPSFLNWTLHLLGLSCFFGGDPEGGDRYWDESVAVPVPPKTNSPNETLAARAAFRQGRHRDAYTMLIAYIDELTEFDNMSGAVMVGLAYVNMMTEIDRLGDAAVVLGHFDASGLFSPQGPGFERVMAEPIARVDADDVAAEARRSAASKHLSELDALTTMRSVLAELTGDD